MLTLIMFAATGFALNQVKQVKGDQNWNAALAAAQAGVDEYISRLNSDGTYWRFGNPSSPYSAGVHDDAAHRRLGERSLHGLGRHARHHTRSYFRYDVNNALFTSQGILKLRASGKVGDEIRTVDVQIRRRGFIDYLYFTDYDTKDPAAYETIVGDDYTPTQAQTNCAKHWLRGPHRRDQRREHRLHHHPVHRLGRRQRRHPGPAALQRRVLHVRQPELPGRHLHVVEPDQRRALQEGHGCSGNPVFAIAGDPKYASPLTMPPSNNSIRKEVDPVYSNPVGCLYVGPTKIVLNSTGTMNVTSPWTQNGGPAWCGVGNNLPLPANGVIYVESVPAVRDAYTRTAPTTACINSGAGNPLGFPQTNDMTVYGCKAGDVFLEGSLKGQLTIAAENNIIATWHIDYAGGSAGTDLLGLVANNYIEVYHPVRCTTTSGGQCTAGTNLVPTGKSAVFTNARINAALLSVNHSFRVQNYRWGTTLGTLNITGAIAQRYRGIVGSGSAGFAKNYVYDARLRYASPPKFLDPIQSAYQPSLWSEPRPAYTS